MEALGLILLGISLFLGLAVFRLGVRADWHWAGALVAALVPIAFTFFLGIIGLIIGGVFLGAVWKTTA